MTRTALALALLLSSSIVTACICAPPEGTPAQAAEAGLAKSEVVALMKIRNIRQKRLSPDAEPVLVAEFEPLELFKGKEKARPSYLAKVVKSSHDGSLKVEAGIHEVELFGPGKPRIFKVHVTRGDRVAQYIEFPGRR